MGLKWITFFLKNKYNQTKLAFGSFFCIYKAFYTKCTKYFFPRPKYILYLLIIVDYICVYEEVYSGIVRQKRPCYQ